MNNRYSSQEKDGVRTQIYDNDAYTLTFESTVELSDENININMGRKTHDQDKIMKNLFLDLFRTSTYFDFLKNTMETYVAKGESIPLEVSQYLLQCIGNKPEYIETSENENSDKKR